jgi:hypothetical protein
MSPHTRIQALLVVLASLLSPPAVLAQSASARGVSVATALASLYQDDYDYSYWRQQVRVASPVRHARWDAAPRGAVRVYHRRFDARWNWRTAPRHHVVYTYHRGDLWFLDPTTGWAYSVDQYGIVYTADPYRGWVYSLGPLTRWTADLLYFFDLYRFDRGYWYCEDYDYFVDLWEEYPRGDYYTYDTAYSTLWGWEPYWSSPTFVSFSINFSTVWVRHVRWHYDYIEHNPHYRREMLDSIGLPAVQAVPPRQLSPRAVATTAYWEARDLAAAGLRPPPRGRDTGRSWEAGTVVDTRDVPSRVVDSGAPAPGFNAPFPDDRYGIGAGEGDPKPDSGQARGLPTPADRVKPGRPAGHAEAASPPRFDAPAYTPRDKPTRVDPVYDKPQREEPRYEKPQREEPRYEKPQREEPRYEKPPREAPRYEKPQREEPRYEKPAREEPRYEKPVSKEPKEDRKDERSSSRSALSGLGVRERED